MIGTFAPWSKAGIRLTDDMLRLTNDIQCKTCRYSLKGLTSSRCPECGTGFNLKDPYSYIHHVVSGGQILAASAISCAVIAIPMGVTLAIRLLEVIGFVDMRMAGPLMKSVIFGVWLACPAIGWLIARDCLREARFALKETIVTIDQPVLAKIGYALLLMIVWGPAVLIGLVLVLFTLTY